MTRGTTFYHRDAVIGCVECGWIGRVSDARHGRQRPGSPHYCKCPECWGVALESDV